MQIIGHYIALYPSKIAQDVPGTYPRHILMSLQGGRNSSYASPFFLFLTISRSTVETTHTAAANMIWP